MMHFLLALFEAIGGEGSQIQDLKEKEQESKER